VVWLKISGAIFLIFILLIVVLSPTFVQSGLAPGSDTGAHIYIPKYITDYLLAHHKLPQINPYWYNGFEMVHKIAPLVYILIGLVYLLIKDVVLLSKVMHFLLLVLVALSMFTVIYKKRGNILEAFGGAILFSLTPIVLFQVVGAGSYPRVISLALFPFCFYYTDELLENDRKYVSLAILPILFSLALLGHPMTGLVIILFLALYAILRILLDRSVRLIGFFHWAAAGFLTFTLTAWYLLPFISEPAGYGTTVPEQVAEIGSIPLFKQISWLGFLSLFLALFVLYRRRDKALKILFFTGVVAMIFATGTYFWPNKFLPIQSIYPFMGLLFTAFVFSYVGSMTISLQRSLPIALLLVVIITSLYVSQGHQESLRGIKASADFNATSTLDVSQKLRTFRQPGRVMLMKYPFDFIIWWLPVLARKPMIEGWYNSITPTSKHIAWMYDAIDYGYPRYVVEKLNHRNVRYLLLVNRTFTGARYQEFLEEMKRDGFQKVYENSEKGEKNSGYTLYLKNKKSTYLIPLKHRVLVIGKNATNFSSLVPSIQAGSFYLEDYDLEVLKHFDILVLYGFEYRNRKIAEELIKKYLKLGGKVIVNLLGTEKYPLEENASFLGVNTYPRTFSGPILLQPANSLKQEINSLPSRLDLPSQLKEGKRIPLKDWRFVEYLGLDQSLLKLTNKADGLFDVAGYKKIEGKRILFLGPNLFYHAFLTHNEAELRYIQNLVSANEVSERRRSEPKVKIGQEIIQPEYLKFRYSSNQEVPLLVSFTYSPHWKAFLDGKEIKVYNLEDLMFLSLPEGKHSVEMKYGTTPIHFYANGTSLVTLFFLVGLLYKDRQKLKRQRNCKTHVGTDL